MVAAVEQPHLAPPPPAEVARVHDVEPGGLQPQLPLHLTAGAAAAALPLRRRRRREGAPWRLAGRRQRQRRLLDHEQVVRLDDDQARVVVGGAVGLGDLEHKQWGV